MENAMNNGKVRALNENVPLLIELDDKRERYLQSMRISSGFQPYAENIDVGSPIARYFYAGSQISNKSGEALSSPVFKASKYRSTKTQHYCNRLSLSPLSSIENLETSPPMYETRVKVEEEVFVMDDIQVRPMSGGKNQRSSSFSSSRGSSSSSPMAKSVLKTGICRAWEESGHCRYNAKCQARQTQYKEVAILIERRRAKMLRLKMLRGKTDYVKNSLLKIFRNSHRFCDGQFSHGKEEFHPNRLPAKSKYEAQMNKFSPTPGVAPGVTPGVSIYGPNSRLPDVAEPERAVTRLPISQQTSPLPHGHADHKTFSDWSPLDDDINCFLPNDPDRVLSREEVDAYILGTLNKRTTKKRLPIFESLCEGQ